MLLCDTHLQESAVDVELGDVVSQSRHERLPCLRSAALQAPARGGASHRVSGFHVARKTDATEQQAKRYEPTPICKVDKVTAGQGHHTQGFLAAAELCPSEQDLRGGLTPSGLSCECIQQEGQPAALTGCKIRIT